MLIVDNFYIFKFPTSYQRNEISTGLVEMLDFFLVVVFVLKFMNNQQSIENAIGGSKRPSNVGNLLTVVVLKV